MGALITTINRAYNLRPRRNIAQQKLLALGLVLVFNFFDGLGGMAILVAWWGIWHIIAGLVTAFIFTRKKLPQTEGAHE